jgi:hypothetical protein
VTDSEAVRRATHALLKARDRVGDNEQAVKKELLSMMNKDPSLHDAMATYGLALLAEKQSTRH